MITTAKAFVTSDQKTHATLEDAQKHELNILWLDKTGTPDVPEWVLANRDKLLDILSTKPGSKVRARKII